MVPTSRLRVEAQWLPEPVVALRGTVTGRPELTESEAPKQMGADTHPACPFGNYKQGKAMERSLSTRWYVLAVYMMCLLIPVPYIKWHCI